jgi:nucleoside-diphosphate-sugar epimerase
MRILITGEAGFVGSGLALHLRQACSDATVVCMDNLYRRESALNLSRLQKAGVEFHRGDVRDGKSFPAGSFDYRIEPLRRTGAAVIRFCENPLSLQPSC